MDQPERILAALTDKEMTSTELAKVTGIGSGSVAACMSKLKDRRLVYEVRRVRVGRSRAEAIVWARILG